MRALMIALARTVIVPCVAISVFALNARADEPILPNLPAISTIAPSTVPANGDVNPYGVAFVPDGFRRGGPLHPGDILVSNFNASSNLQGTGTTIVRVTPTGAVSVFYQGPPAPSLGLTTALGVLRSGYVIVGNVPTIDGTAATIQPTSLIILDRFGTVVATLSDPDFLDGPWDLTIYEDGPLARVFVSCVLNGTVTRLDLFATPNHGISVVRMTRIASGYAFHPDPIAFLVGPTGLAYDEHSGRLYVASTGDNAIFSIAGAAHRNSDAGMGQLVYSDDAHLRGPLGLILTPIGDLITTNGDAVNGDVTQPSEMVEFTKHGQFIAQVPVNNTGQGGAFGLAIRGDDDRMVFAAVDDIAFTLDVWVLRERRH